MELVLVFLSTAIGTAVGVTAAIFIATDAGTSTKSVRSSPGNVPPSANGPPPRAPISRQSAKRLRNLRQSLPDGARRLQA